MKKLFVLMAAIALIMPLQAKKTKQLQQTDREYWCSLAW